MDLRQALTQSLTTVDARGGHESSCTCHKKKRMKRDKKKLVKRGNYFLNISLETIKAIFFEKAVEHKKSVKSEGNFIFIFTCLIVEEKLKISRVSEGLLHNFVITSKEGKFNFNFFENDMY